jgi:carbamoyl-phosphate synthase large subunit
MGGNGPRDAPARAAEPAAGPGSRGHGDAGRPRILVTSAGEHAGVAFIRRILAAGTAEIVAADVNGYAAGLYLVPAERRFLIPPGDDLGFGEAIAFLCTVAGIDVVVPMGDTELLPLARARDSFDAAGVALLLAPAETLAICLDTLRLVHHCAAAGIAVPATAPVDPTFDPAGWAGAPCVVRPRAGGRGARLVRDPGDLRRLSRYAGLMVQEYLPGQEYSIDVLAGSDGRVRAAVPRSRLKIDAGVTVAGRTLHDDDLEAFGREVARAIGLRWVANIQCRRDVRGDLRLLKVNPRFPGTMPLTVAAGVDMPGLALAGVLGVEPPDAVAFTDVAMVRHWEEVPVAVGAFTEVPRVGSDRESRRSPLHDAPAPAATVLGRR